MRIGEKHGKKISEGNGLLSTLEEALEEVGDKMICESHGGSWDIETAECDYNTF